MKCKDVMVSNPRCCTIFSNAIAAAQIMHEDDVGLVPVIDEMTRILIGMITERDLCLEVVAKGENPRELKVGECMSANPVACHSEDDIQDTDKLMKKHQIRHIPVMDQNGRCIGLIAQADIEREIWKVQEVFVTVHNYLSGFSLTRVVS